MWVSRFQGPIICSVTAEEARLSSGRATCRFCFDSTEIIFNSCHWFPACMRGKRNAINDKCRLHKETGTYRAADAQGGPAGRLCWPRSRLHVQTQCTQCKRIDRYMRSHPGHAEFEDTLMWVEGGMRACAYIARIVAEGPSAAPSPTGWGLTELAKTSDTLLASAVCCCSGEAKPAGNHNICARCCEFLVSSSSRKHRH